MGPVLQHRLQQLVAIAGSVLPAEHPHRFIQDRRPVRLPGLRLNLLAEVELRFLHGRGDGGPGDLLLRLWLNVAGGLHLLQAILQRPIPIGLSPELVRLADVGDRPLLVFLSEADLRVEAGHAHPL